MDAKGLLVAGALAVVACACGDEEGPLMPSPDDLNSFGGTGGNPGAAGAPGGGALGNGDNGANGANGIGQPGGDGGGAMDGAGGAGGAMGDGGGAMGGSGGAMGGTGGMDVPGPGPGLGESDCLDGITDYTGTGPFSVQSKTSGKVNMWVPDVPAGCKVPVIHLANGTSARCSSYLGALEHMASHGFLVTCYEDPNTGQGTQCIEALQTVFNEYPDVAANKIGSTGHSQGGGASLVCLYRAEQKWGDSMTYTAHAIEPAHGYGDSPADYASMYAQIESPVFMFNGSNDGLVSASWVKRGFDELDPGTEAYWYEAVGASHMTPIPISWINESATAWFRWKLLGDKQACEYFKNMPNSSEWADQQSQNESGC